MPIFQADLEHDTSVDPDPHPLPIDRRPSSLRRLSEESLPTELCDGPLPDSPGHSPVRRSDDEAAISSRAELIERLKRGESPTWIPNRHLESIFQQQRSPPPKPSRTPSNSSSLLPPAQITPERSERASPIDQKLRDGLSIERPRSALHSGDFTVDEDETSKLRSRPEEQVPDTSRQSNNSSSSWLATSPPRDFRPFKSDADRRSAFQSHSRGAQSLSTSPLSLSSSFSSSFVYQPPTSPLVQSESNEELEIAGPLGGIRFSSSANSRRHTLHSSHSSPQISPSFRLPFPPPSPRRREGALPYQAHQPRRSLSGMPNFVQTGSSPQTPAYLRSRRPSLGSDSSPIQQHTSMVGSYEESILRGRMSTTPSRPLDFLIQIGVLGMGKCKSSLKCPPHVTLPFPAVYYSYGTTSHGRSRMDDGPSPYVGQIDLENGLPNSSDETRSRRKAHSRYADKVATDVDTDIVRGGQASDKESHRTSRPKRRSGSLKAPPGGSYRIPEKGQIQIIIKNQNKTAVKLFLVPYDLAGMEPGTKTFVRQRSYSTGPIIDGIPKATDDPADRPILRYLVHLHICCPSKGRFYLYKSIRVVFANRVPDGKEKLRNETTWPEPRFTPYKPIRVMHPPLSTSSGPGAMLTADKAFRRRSSGFSLGISNHTFDMMDGIQSLSQPQPIHASNSGNGNTVPVDPIPFRLPPRNRPSSETSDVTSTTTIADLQSPESSQASRPSTKDSSSDGLFGPARYTKLSKGDLGYGGNAFSPPASGSPGGTEGLLSQRLRSLGVKNHEQHQDGE